ncbi:hypothetical protein [Actinotalea sp. Marseille-Q4924]|uniref:hypothetical protein n=1 Tax=Actinotalea sp. Marseille-Q4924 TaxID=2866571 RepID=UPI001CE3F6BE|nr:hypothetical protein [Actinotalea sp. Marseille-Q4924]
MSTTAMADIEWILERNDWVVHDFQGVLVMSFESGVHIFVSAIDLAGVSFVCLRASVGSDLQPSPALYRWVATQAGESIVGALDADVTEDGLVAVTLQYFVPVDGFNDDTVDVLVGAMCARAEGLKETVTQMFA